MRLRTGTSGFAYKEWKGTFYPAKLPEKEMLHHYSRRLETVELNNTFYRMPSSKAIEQWASGVPQGFTFVLKASRRITHIARLGGTDDTLDYLLRQAQGLGEHLGPILFQLPPNMKKDLPRLEAFLAKLSGRTRAAFEFRHPTWISPDVHAALSRAGAALCLADNDDDEQPPQLVPTASWGYLRLRRTSYSESDLRRWLEKLRSSNFEEAFVFFKHEAEGAAPRFAESLRDLAT